MPPKAPKSPKAGARGGKTLPKAPETPAPTRKQKSKEVECQTEPEGEEVEVQTEDLDTENRTSQTLTHEFKDRDAQTEVKEFEDAETSTESNLEEKSAQTIGIPARPDFFLEMLLQLSPNNFIQVQLAKKTISICLQAGRVVVRTGGGYMELQKFLERTCVQSEYLDSVGLGRRPRLWSGNAQPRMPGRSTSPTKQMLAESQGVGLDGRPGTAPAAPETPEASEAL